MESARIAVYNFLRDCALLSMENNKSIGYDVFYKKGPANSMQTLFLF